MKLSMKKKTIALGFSLLLGQFPLFAQVMPIVNATGSGDPIRVLTGSMQGSYINCPTGQCSFNVPSIVDTMLLGFLNNTNEITRKRYSQLVDNSKLDMNELLRSVFSGPNSLNALSQKSALSGSMIPVEDLYKAYTEFVQKMELVRQDFEMNAQFFRGELPGIELKDSQYIAKTLPTIAGGSVNGLLNGFNNSLKAISNMVCSLKFSLMLPTGEPYLDQQVLKCDPTSGAVAIVINAEGVRLTEGERNSLIDSMNELRRPTDRVITNVDNFAGRTRGVIKALVEAWGTSQSFRLADLDAESLPFGLGHLLPDRILKGNNDREAIKKGAFDTVVEYFWLRSALRKTFGLPIGSFAINYDKKKLQTDIFSTKYQALINLPEDSLFVQSDSWNNSQFLEGKDYEQKRFILESLYADALNTADSKASDVVKGNFGMIDRANGLYESLKGDKPAWKVMNFVLKLMAADFFEDSAMRKPGGMQKVISMYRARYIDIPDSERQRYIPLIESFNKIVFGKENENSTSGDVNFSMSDDIRSNYGELANELREWTTRISQSRVIRVQLDVAQRVGSAPEFKQAMQRAQEL